MSKTVIVFPQGVDMDELSFFEKRRLEATRSRLHTNEIVAGKVVIFLGMSARDSHYNAISTILQALEYSYLVCVENTGEKQYVCVSSDFVTTLFCVVIHGLQIEGQYNNMVGRVLYKTLRPLLQV